MPYKSFDDWMNEIEGYGMRQERIPDEAYEWAKLAWELAWASAEAEQEKNNLALERIIQAWESLPAGQHSPKTIDRWLNDVMKPAIDFCRERNKK